MYFIIIILEVTVCNKDTFLLYEYNKDTKKYHRTRHMDL